MRAYDDALVWVRKGIKIDPYDVTLQKLELRVKALKFKTKVVGVIKAMFGAK